MRSLLPSSVFFASSDHTGSASAAAELAGSRPEVTTQWPTIPQRVQPPHEAPGQPEQHRGACMGKEGVREDLRQAFGWPLPRMLPGEMGEEKHGAAKHFPSLQVKAVDKEERGLNSGWAPLKLLSLFTSETVVSPQQALHLRVICEKQPDSSASLPVSCPARSSVRSCHTCPACHLAPQLPKHIPRLHGSLHKFSARCELLSRTHHPHLRKHFLQATNSQENHTSNFRGIIKSLPSQLLLDFTHPNHKSSPSVVDTFSLHNASALIRVTVA